MKKVCFVSAGSGGSEINNILIKHLQKNKDYKIISLAITPFAKEKLDNYLYVEKENVIEYLKTIKPAVIINEVSNDLKIQNEVTNFANKNNILNISVLDFYGNYKERFKAVPNYILTPSDSIKNELVQQIHINASRVISTGNPTFDKIQNLSYSREQKNKVLFISQPLLESNIDNQYIVFNEFVEEILKYAKPTIFIKPHPREVINTWKKIIANNNYKNIELIDFDNNNDFLITCVNYDLIIGYHSTLLLQCYYAKIPQISYLQNWKEALSNYFNNKFVNQTKYNDFKKNSTKSTIQTITKLITSNVN